MEHVLDLAMEPKKHQPNGLHMLPEMFTFLCFLIFIPPHVTSIHVTMDPNVRFWMGDTLHIIALFLSPMLIIAGHIPYRLRGAPSKLAIVLSMIGPSIVFGILSNHILTKALNYGNQFAANDCKPPSEKFDLEESWRVARTFYAGCSVQEDVNPKEYLIHNCIGYYERNSNNSAWQYLAQVEVKYRCGGWCALNQTLWTFNVAQDSCSTAISQVMSGKVVSKALQVVVYSIFLLALSSISLILLGPSLRW